MVVATQPMLRARCRHRIPALLECAAIVTEIYVIEGKCEQRGKDRVRSWRRGVIRVSCVVVGGKRCGASASNLAESGHNSS